MKKYLKAIKQIFGYLLVAGMLFGTSYYLTSVYQRPLEKDEVAIVIDEQTNERHLYVHQCPPYVKMKNKNLKLIRCFDTICIKDIAYIVVNDQTQKLNYDISCHVDSVSLNDNDIDFLLYMNDHKDEHIENVNNSIKFLYISASLKSNYEKYINDSIKQDITDILHYNGLEVNYIHLNY